MPRNRAAKSQTFKVFPTVIQQPEQYVCHNKLPGGGISGRSGISRRILLEIVLCPATSRARNRQTRSRIIWNVRRCTYSCGVQGGVVTKNGDYVAKTLCAHTKLQCIRVRLPRRWVCRSGRSACSDDKNILRTYAFLVQHGTSTRVHEPATQYCYYYYYYYYTARTRERSLSLPSVATASHPRSPIPIFGRAAGETEREWVREMIFVHA